METRHYDLIVIGGGLAGLASAILFAKAGKKVLLFEKDQYPFHKVCGEYMSNESFAFLEQLGLDLNSMDLPKINRLRVSDPYGYELQETLALGGFGLSRYTLDHALARLAKEAGAELLEGKEVQSWEYSREEDMFSVKQDGQAYKAKILLAAYGKRTKLDKWLKRAFMFQKEPYVAVKYHIRYPVKQDEIALHNFKNGYCGISAIEDGKVCLCYLAHADDLKEAGSIEALEKTVLRQNPHLNDIWEKAEFLYDKPLVISRFSFKPKKQVENHAVFAGDAAGLIPPLCGNGMSMALHAAKLFFEAYSGNQNETNWRKLAEHQYQRTWDKQFSLRLKTGRNLQSLFGSPFLTALFLRSVSPFKGLKRLLIRGTHGREF